MNLLADHQVTERIFEGVTVRLMVVMEVADKNLVPRKCQDVPP